MHRTIRRALKITGTIIVVLLVVLTIWFVSGEGKPAEEITWGVTFFPQQATDLGLDWKEAYLALLDDMGARRLRLAAPWNMVEQRRGQYDFGDIEWMLEQAATRKATVSMAIGRKLFRWPECHDPAWISDLTPEAFESGVLAFVRASVEKLGSHENIVSWQVENEVTFPFGECHAHKPTKELFAQELALVRSLDPRPITSTDSGELSSWLSINSGLDRYGISLYRVTKNPNFGDIKFYYPLRPGFYRKKASLSRALNPHIQGIYLSELQLEPWTIKPIAETTLREQYDSMSFARMQSTIDFAAHTGFDEIYLWGAEWWYWLKKQHHDARYWNEAQELMYRGTK